MPILDFSGNYWEVVHDATLEAIQITPSRYLPISDYQLPLSLTTHTLLVGASSFKAKPSWRLGFYLNMIINSPGVGNFLAGRQAIPLGLSLVRFPPLSSEFSLKAVIPKWHQEMSLRVWRYTGSELDVPDYLHEINVDLIRIENKLDSMSY